MYWIGTFGPIEVGRVTKLDNSFFVTVNAVATDCPIAGFCKQQAKPETSFIKYFDDLYQAQDYAVSFFKKNAQPFIQWTFYP